jgi:murein DD-endopeptidase MepM/ murein hydrolase activator NlpD
VRNDPIVGSSTLAPTASGCERREVARLAREFEAMLMTQMLREMRRSMLTDESQDAGLGGSAMTDTIDIELGQALSRVGGFGLSTVLTGALEKSRAGGGMAAPSSPSPMPAPPPEAGLADLPAPGQIAADVISAPEGAITSGFGWRRDPLTGAPRFHKGIDVAQPIGQNVMAAASGRVVAAGNHGDYGTMIVVDHGGGQQTRYAHLSASAVQVGDQVGVGQVIGKTGDSGRTTGPHLHFEVMTDGRAVDPGRH